ncbi:MAG: PIN domain-containing protein [Burkholderiales bacterium]
MRTNHVLIDFESVQPDSLGALEQEHFKVHIFVGANQARLPYAVADAVQRMGSRANYVKISGNGSNALDFHIAFYIGQLAAADSSAYFHIISKDTGFDPLIQHLKSRNILAGRVKTVTDIPLVKVANSKSPEDRLAAVVQRLRQMKASRPRTLKTLRSTIASLFQKQLSDAEIDSLVKALSVHKIAILAANKMSYFLDGKQPVAADRDE